MEYVCRIGTSEGRIVEEVIEARTEEAVRAELERRGVHVLAIRRRGLARFALSLAGGRRRRVAPQDLEIFNQEFAALLRAGLPVLQSLGVLLERKREPLFREVLIGVHEKVKNGQNLSDAFASYPDLVPGLYPATLKAGERSGNLEPVLRRFLRYQKLMGEARRKVVSAVVYPAVLVALSVVLIGIMTFYVVPKFKDFFDALEGDLPLLTRVTMGLATFVTDRWLPILLVVIGVAAFLGQWNRSRRGKLILDRLKLRIPLLGEVFQKLSVSEFCRALSTLLAGGIPVVSALETAVSSVGNAHIRERVRPLTTAVEEGESLHRALERTGVSPEIVTEMARVGEETGALDIMLGNASDFLDEEIDTRMQRLLTLVEPIMLVLMGSIVALLLIAMYMPLFSMLGQMQG